MTDYEIYTYEAFRKHLHDDERVIERAKMSLLDQDKVQGYLLRMREERPGFSKLSMEQAYEMLAITRDGIPTLAAILNFGLYPQGYFPQLAITAIVVPGQEIGDVSQDSVRFSDNVDFENCAYPYGHFVDAKSFESLPNGNYPIGLYRINFRGNTGWLLEKNDEEVKICEPIVYGRWNNGVITINIPHVALEAKKEAEEKGIDPVDKFFEIFTERMELVHEGLKLRHEH